MSKKTNEIRRKIKEKEEKYKRKFWFTCSRSTKGTEETIKIK